MMRTNNSWIVLQARDSHYADIEGRCYEYPTRIPQAQRVRPGDVLVVCLPSSDAKDGKRIIGLARIGHIRKATIERFVANYDRFQALATPATFDEIGGDPRKNQTSWNQFVGISPS